MHLLSKYWKNIVDSLVAVFCNKQQKEEVVMEQEPENTITEDRPEAQAEYVINFQTIDGESHTFTWINFPLRWMGTETRPHSNSGIRYMVDGAHIFIPWHQVLASSFKETVLWDDGF